jgi:ribosomal protein L9
MEVILLERVEKLGAIGDVVKVKNGYARNFLLPNGKALRANEANRKVFESNRERIETQNAERRSAAERDSKGVEGVTVQLIRQASNVGQLYGSVSARDLAEALEAQGHKIAKNQIVLDRPIKAIGIQDVRIALHPKCRSRSGSTSPARRKRRSSRLRASTSWPTCSKGQRRLHRGLRSERRARRNRGHPREPGRQRRGCERVKSALRHCEERSDEATSVR